MQLHEICRRLAAQLLISIVACLTTTHPAIGSEPAGSQVDAHLAAGEFGPARSLADAAGDGETRDRLRGRIAIAQRDAGARRGAFRTAYGIDNDRTRGAMFDQLAGYAPEPGGRGGAALADFDTLINLITTTVEPDSWDVIGGPGAVESFPTGVFVDAKGLMRRISVESRAGGLAAVHRAATRDRAAGGRDVHSVSRLRKVSLNRLERHIQMLWAQGRRPDAAMQSLAGIYDLEYVLFYPETRDIVLAGPASGWRDDADGRRLSEHTGSPVLQLDDFVVVLRNAFHDAGTFGCAITPSSERLASVQSFLAKSSEKPLSRGRRAAWLTELQEELGPQDISVFGIDPATHAGRVLVEADYHMKLVGMGLAEGTLGVQSYLDTVRLGADGRPPAMDVLRWWFTVNYSGIRTNPNRTGFEFVGTGVQVQSENELLDARGGRIHTGKSDELNLQFARSFTNHFEDLALKYPVYAELRNIFDLAVAAQLIRSEGLADQIEWEMGFFNDSDRFIVATGSAPERVNSVINHRVIDRKHLIVGVSGGVRFDSQSLLAAARIPDDANRSVGSAHLKRRPQDVADDKWWWD